jgi:predicted enzyme related to lactoylglutathione lyase
MPITKVAFTPYPAKDAPTLLAFYRDVLGLRLSAAHPSVEEAQYAEFEVGDDHWFDLLPEKMLGRPAGSGSGIVFEVDDIDAMVEKIRPHVRALQPIADYPHCRMTWFEDPEGNNVSLHQMLE